MILSCKLSGSRVLAAKGCMLLAAESLLLLVACSWHQSFACCGRQALEAKRCLLESLQKRCTAAQAKLEGEYGHLGSLEAKTRELESLRKVLPDPPVSSLQTLSVLQSCGLVGRMLPVAVPIGQL